MMWELDHKEGWAPKNWCFWTVVPEKTPWIARRSNHSTLKEINAEYSLEGLVLKLHYSGHLIWKADSLEKTLMLAKTEGKRRREWQRVGEMVGWHHWFKGHQYEQTPGDSEGQGNVACHMGHHGIAKSQAWLRNWTTALFKIQSKKNK